jgi:hypothetical protein
VDVAYRLVTPAGSDEEWHADLATAHAAVATRLGIDAASLQEAARRVTVDPVVVRHHGARWRSRQVWDYRSPKMTVRLFEMLRIDEALYDH